VKQLQYDHSTAFEYSHHVRDSAHKSLYELVAWNKGNDVYAWLFDMEAVADYGADEVADFAAFPLVAFGALGAGHWANPEGTRVQFTTTTTLPTGLSLNTDYIIKPSDISDSPAFFKIYTTAGVLVSPSDAGTGDHTATAIDIPRQICKLTSDSNGGLAYTNGIPYQYGINVLLSSSASAFAAYTTADCWFEITYST
jgi:hypothetical protein